MTSLPASLSSNAASHFRLKPRSADCRDLVDEVDVEADAHRDAEREPRLHARRVSPHRLVQVRAELGEAGDEVEQIALVRAVDPRHESGVLGASQRAVEAAREAERPGDAAPPDHPPAIGSGGAGDQAQEGRLARSVPAQQREAPPPRDRHG